MTTLEQQAREIAGKLTEGQRRRLTRGIFYYGGRPKITRGGSVERRLRERGLAEPHSWGWDALTPLGLAVRRILTEKDG